MKQQDIIDFLSGLSNSFIQGLSQPQRFDVESMEKTRMRIFRMGIAIALSGVGFFLILWGISSTIDTMFAMHGFGFVLVGIIAVLTGALTFRR